MHVNHFRGVENYWEIPADTETTAEVKWKRDPGLEFFEEMFKELAELPIIVEDLGSITSEVNLLRENCGFPRMKVLLFSFLDGNNSYLP